MAVIVGAVALVVLSRVGDTRSREILDREVLATGGEALE